MSFLNETGALMLFCQIYLNYYQNIKSFRNTSYVKKKIKKIEVPSPIGKIIPVLRPIDVAFGPRRPEDWPDILHLSFGMSTNSPGQRSP